jgi:hypothetical protein
MGKKYDMFLTIILIVSIIAIVVLVGFWLFDMYSKNRIEQDALDAIEEFNRQVGLQENQNNVIEANLTPVENTIVDEPILQPEPEQEDNISTTSIEDDTIPDEDFDKNQKHRNKINSYPNVLSEHRGPNINLKIAHKRYSNQKEKEMFFEKIKRKKKTELCKNYELYKDCYYGDNCSFAHGIEELRENVILPSYKTKLCKSFVENGTCNFGIRCSYQHKIK